MTDAQLEARLRQVLCAAKARSGWRSAALTNALIDQIAHSGAPLLRELVDAAVEARLGHVA